MRVALSQEQYELISDAFTVTKNSRNIFDRVNRYRCKLLYNSDLGVDELTKDDMSDINIALQEYSGILCTIMYRLLGVGVPHISSTLEKMEKMEKDFIRDNPHIKKTK